MKNKTGGQAFPRPMSSIYEQESGCQHYSNEQEGMTLRDYFAAKAMQGDIVGISEQPLPENETVEKFWADKVSFYYMIADLMLAEREK